MNRISGFNLRFIKNPSAATRGGRFLSAAPESFLLSSSLIVKTADDREDSGRALVRRDDGQEPFHLFVVSEVSDPVGAAGGRRGDVPLHRGLTLPVGTLQPVEPAATAHSVLSVLTVRY